MHIEAVGMGSRVKCFLVQTFSSSICDLAQGGMGGVGGVARKIKLSFEHVLIFGMWGS